MKEVSSAAGPALLACAAAAAAVLSSVTQGHTSTPAGEGAAATVSGSVLPSGLHVYTAPSTPDGGPDVGKRFTDGDVLFGLLVNFAGYGHVTPKKLGFTMAPTPATRPDITHATLVTTVDSY